MQGSDIEALKLELGRLRLEHRDLDAAIAGLESAVYADQLAIRRLKRRKLQLKDQIARLESRLIPDLNA